MLKSCKYCGRIHEEKNKCAQRIKAEAIRQEKRKQTDAVFFRKTYLWTNKSKAVRKRDAYMCLCCLAELKGTVKKYNTENISVHHITPIVEDFSKRLDEFNLISVCDIHHEMCEAGEISRETQRALVLDAVGHSDKDETLFM